MTVLNKENPEKIVEKIIFEYECPDHEIYKDGGYDLDYLDVSSEVIYELKKELKELYYDTLDKLQTIVEDNNYVDVTELDCSFKVCIAVGYEDEEVDQISAIIEEFNEKAYEIFDRYIEDNSDDYEYDEVG